MFRVTLNRCCNIHKLRLLKIKRKEYVASQEQFNWELSSTYFLQIRYLTKKMYKIACGMIGTYPNQELGNLLAQICASIPQNYRQISRYLNANTLQLQKSEFISKKIYFLTLYYQVGTYQVEPIKQCQKKTVFHEKWR